jgi:hypothetical protein
LAVLRVPMDCKVSRVFKEQEGLKGLQESKASKECRVLKEYKVL